MVPEIDLNFGDYIMNTNKQFFVTLEYHCDFEPQYDYNKEVGQAFNTFEIGRAHV